MSDTAPTTVGVETLADQLHSLIASVSAVLAAAHGRADAFGFNAHNEVDILIADAHEKGKRLSEAGRVALHNATLSAEAALEELRKAI